MSTIIVNPLKPQEEVTSEVIQLQILVKEEDWFGFFNKLEVWRSRNTPAGPYEELTADQWKPARIPKTAGDKPATPVVGASLNIVGKDLQLRFNEKEDIVVVFTGTDPLTLADVASQIDLQAGTRATSYVDADGVLVVETTDVGTGAVLRIVGGEAAAIIGLPTVEPDSLAFGKEAKISLIQGKSTYLFSDLFGSADYFYKTRFFNSSTLANSEFSIAFGARQGIGVSEESLVCGQLDLVDLNGQPIRNAEVRLHASFDGTQVEGKTVSGQDLCGFTDEQGHVEFVLVRGMKVTVAIIGTSLVRDITTPTDPTVSAFSLLDPSISGDDIFKVKVPDVVFAERRSL